MGELESDQTMKCNGREPGIQRNLEGNTVEKRKAKLGLERGPSGARAETSAHQAGERRGNKVGGRYVNKALGGWESKAGRKTLKEKGEIPKERKNVVHG